MDIVPIITKDNLSKEQIEYLQKQKAEYKLKNKVRCVPGHTLFSFNQKTKEIKSAGICSEERSLISPDYARNFICDFILGKVQKHTQLDLFK